jgi:uncharacterized protein
MSTSIEKPTIQMSEADERMWAMFAHLSTLLSFIFPIIGTVIGPILIWQIQKDKSDFVSYHGKTSLNFQITMLIISGICVLLCFVLIGFFFLWILGIVWVILIIIASIKAHNGEYYKYPFSLKIV